VSVCVLKPLPNFVPVFLCEKQFTNLEDFPTVLHWFMKYKDIKASMTIKKLHFSEAQKCSSLITCWFIH